MRHGDGTPRRWAVVEGPFCFRGIFPVPTHFRQSVTCADPAIPLCSPAEWVRSDQAPPELDAYGG